MENELSGIFYAGDDDDVTIMTAEFDEADTAKKKAKKTEPKKKTIPKVGRDMTRELWLNRAAKRLMDVLVSKAHHDKVPDIKQYAVSCGFPRGGGGGGGTPIGQAWSAESSTAERKEMFISPLLDDPIEVLATLLHELVHVTIGNKEKHGKKFKELAREQLGLAGKLTATFCDPQSDLHVSLTAVSKKLGPYPHAKMVIIKKTPHRASWVRYVSESPDMGKYKITVSPLQVDNHGVPKDPTGKDMVPLDGKDRNS
jgi:hypothetical protein